jgi:hypothetical protein
MRIPAINSDFNPIICHAIGQKGQYILTVRLNMTQKPDFKAVICHTMGQAQIDREN